MKKILPVLLLLFFLSCNKEQDIILGNNPVETSEEVSDEGIHEEIKDEYKNITWWDLISQREITYYEDLNAQFEADPNYFRTTDPPTPGINSDINGIKVRIPGFVVGVDSDPDNFAMVYSFLFVPYQGACIHVPPPPTNQTIFVTVDEPIKSNPYEPYWLYGIISTEEGQNDLAAYSYILKADKLETYDGNI